MVLVLLPAFNEEQALPRLLQGVERALGERGEAFRIIVCDDGSRDGTAVVLEEASRRFPLEVIKHKINRGLGESSRDLFERAAETCEDRDVIVRLDCDDTHDPAYIPALIGKLSEGYDVVVASRFEPGGGQVGVSRYRAAVSWLANLFMKVVFPVAGLREYSCGYRAYRGAVIRQAIGTFGNNFIQLKGLGFTCTLEKLVKLKLLGAGFGEVPFVLRYDRKQSQSKMVSSVTTLGYLVMAVMYHWPWGGGRAGWRRRRRDALRVAPDAPGSP